MRGVIPPLHRYVFMSWCLVKHIIIIIIIVIILNTLFCTFHCLLVAVFVFVVDLFITELNYSCLKHSVWSSFTVGSAHHVAMIYVCVHTHTHTHI